MAELITVPTFTFNQGKANDGDYEENPISVDFYNGSIILRQDGSFDQQEKIVIHPKYLDALFKEIKKHRPEAEHMVSKLIN